MNVSNLNSSFRRLIMQSASQKPPVKEIPNEPAESDNGQGQGFISQAQDINQVAKSFSSISDLLKPNLDNMSMQQLTDRAEILRFNILNPKFRGESIPSLRQQLSEVYDVLERHSLEELEHFLGTVDASADNTLTRSELKLMSGNPVLSEDTRLAATFLLGYETRLEALDLAGSSADESGVSISMNDIHARQLQLNADINNHLEPTYSGDGSYTLPKIDSRPVNNITQHESPPRGQALYDTQQDAVEQAIRTGEDVGFTNSNGDELVIKVMPVNGGTNGNYTVSIDGHTVSVSSEIGIGSTIVGIANMIEFGSSMGVPKGVRQFPDALVFKKDIGPEVQITTKDGDRVFNAGARYTREHQLIYFSAEQRIHDAELYYHEIGHGLGLDINSDIFARLFQSLFNSDKPIAPPNSQVDSNPFGWQKIHDTASADNNLVSNYASSHPKESFAEAFACPKLHTKPA